MVWFPLCAHLFLERSNRFLAQKHQLSPSLSLLLTSNSSSRPRRPQFIHGAAPRLASHSCPWLVYFLTSFLIPPFPWCSLRETGLICKHHHHYYYYYYYPPPFTSPPPRPFSLARLFIKSNLQKAYVGQTNRKLGFFHLLPLIVIYSH